LIGVAEDSVTELGDQLCPALVHCRRQKVDAEGKLFSRNVGCRRIYLTTQTT
jgi:hypothetical protein